MTGGIQQRFLAACEQGDSEAVRDLLTRGASVDEPADHWSPLHRAVFSGSVDTIRLLLAKGAPLEARYGNGATPLIDAAELAAPVVARELVAGGADLNGADDAGRTALMIAAMLGRREVVETLLALGADSAHADAEGETAGALARRYGHQELAALLGDVSRRVNVGRDRP